MRADNREFEEALKSARKVSWKNFGKRVRFYAPSFMYYKTSHFRSSPAAFPSISVTGSSCALKCKHCNGRVLNTMFPAPTPKELINLCAMSNTSGAVPMFYIPGFTIEAETVEQAFQGDVPSDCVTVTDAELKQEWEKLQTTSGKIDFVMLGCPHYTLRQIAEASRLLEGKKIQKGVTFWICTSATTKTLAERMGCADNIEKAGGHIVADTCIDEPCWTVYKEKVGMTDSPKCAYYRRFRDVVVAGLEDCVEAAVKGRYE